MNERALAPHLESILDDLMPAAERLAARRRARRRRTRVAVLTAGALAVVSSTAVAALSVIGPPAPPRVKVDLRGVDRGLPRDLQLRPDVARAHAVAASGDAVVYFAALADGGYCAELVTAQGPRGALCSTAEQVDQTPLSVTIPFTDPVTDSSPVAVSGHVSTAGAQAVELVYSDGGSDRFPISERGFYVAEVPRAHLRAVHRGGLVLIARDGDGKPLAQAIVPMDAITPPSEADRPHDPIEIDTVSDEDDLSKVLRVRGSLYVKGAERVMLRYGDGRTVELPLHGKRFDYAVPRRYQKDLMTPGTVTARAADGHVLAERTVAAVAFWRSRDRGGPH